MALVSFYQRFPKIRILKYLSKCHRVTCTPNTLKYIYIAHVTFDFITIWDYICSVISKLTKLPMPHYCFIIWIIIISLNQKQHAVNINKTSKYTFPTPKCYNNCTRWYQIKRAGVVDTHMCVYTYDIICVLCIGLHHFLKHWLIIFLNSAINYLSLTLVWYCVHCHMWPYC